jgi:hypothetical protein
LALAARYRSEKQLLGRVVHNRQRVLAISSDFPMERTGIEPVTFGLQSRRSPS